MLATDIELLEKLWFIIQKTDYHNQFPRKYPDSFDDPQPNEAMIYNAAVEGIVLALGKCSMYNEEYVKASTNVGCYACRRIFTPKQITKWTDTVGWNGKKRKYATAICPYCSVDSLIGDYLNPIPLSVQLLDMMDDQWFGRTLPLGSTSTTRAQPLHRKE